MPQFDDDDEFGLDEELENDSDEEDFDEDEEDGCFEPGTFLIRVQCIDCGHSWVCESVVEPCPECGSTRFENGEEGETEEL